ncbi:MAG: ABC transporter ATP-binding protein [Verrucomicrobiota bacterium]|nr:ABC transporter ATP-binding protein [Verrucomicrobiota bacterium]
MTWSIQFENVSKLYRLGQASGSGNNFREDLGRFFHRLLSAGRETSVFPSQSGGESKPTDVPPAQFWALKNINLEIQQGEVVGLIGRNGAGKSTLLKILSRITQPTTGKLKYRGRVASLLEVGTGFHRELTGKENIYLNGSILGMRRNEITRKLDEIVAFAELENFLDTPVKYYSSGMYVRLAFAVAAHLESEILVVDEVLAVGDFMFQRKCLGKMGEVANAGRTVILVSHNMGIIGNLCKTGILLEGGDVVYRGDISGAIQRYMSGLSANMTHEISDRGRRGSGLVRIYEITFRDPLTGQILDSLRSGQDVEVWFGFKRNSQQDHSRMIASLLLQTVTGVPVFLHHNRLEAKMFGSLPEIGYFVCHLKRLPLPPAVYVLGFSLIENNEFIDGVDQAIELNVYEGQFHESGEVPPQQAGLCLVDARWKIEKIAPDQSPLGKVNI